MGAFSRALASSVIVAVLLASLGLLVWVLWDYLAPGTLGGTSRGAALHNPAEGTEPTPGFAIAPLLRDSPVSASFLQVEGPTEMQFPQDHGPHHGFRLEWWYFTGNLRDAEGREFGYQWTVFRTEIAPEGSPGALPAGSFDGSFAKSQPAALEFAQRPQLFLGHFAVTDVKGQAFHSFQRMGRAALGTAGATSRPLRVFVDQWEMMHAVPSSAVSAPASASAPGQENLAQVTLNATQDNVGLHLRLQATFAPVLQGDAGFSRKGAAPGAASYYYSMPGWRTRGVIDLHGNRFEVSGQSWLDREWSTRSLDANVQGWDWFGLQLDDGTHVMFYQLRDVHGNATPWSSASVIAADGSHRALPAHSIELTVTDTWRSDAGTVYPSAWTVSIVGEVVLNITAQLSDQLWRGAFEYWEGAVVVSGRRGSEKVSGRGYAELVGYAR